MVGSAVDAMWSGRGRRAAGRAAGRRSEDENAAGDLLLSLALPLTPSRGRYRVLRRAYISAMKTSHGRLTFHPGRCDQLWAVQSCEAGIPGACTWECGEDLHNLWRSRGESRGRDERVQQQKEPPRGRGSGPRGTRAGVRHAQGGGQHARLRLRVTGGRRPARRAVRHRRRRRRTSIRCAYGRYVELDGGAGGRGRPRHPGRAGPWRLRGLPRPGAPRPERPSEPVSRRPTPTPRPRPRPCRPPRPTRMPP